MDLPETLQSQAMLEKLMQTRVRNLLAQPAAGTTDIAFCENVEERMRAFGFQTITVENGNDTGAIGMAIEAAKRDTARPSFITIKTQIGYGSPCALALPCFAVKNQQMDSL